jgi:hypothetical protein
MKIDFEELESPYFDGEVEFVAPAFELSQSLASVINDSPFTGTEVDVRIDFLTGKDVRVNKPTDTYVYKYSSGHRK